MADKYAEQVALATRGNTDAIAFLNILTSVLHFFDDVADKDKPLTNADVQAACWSALVELPRNRFYQQFFNELNPVLAVAIQNWSVANTFEASGTDEELNIAFIVRSSYSDLVIHVANLCGGYSHGQDVAHRVRRQWHSETLEGYKANLKQQFEAAQAARGTDHVRL